MPRAERKERVEAARQKAEEAEREMLRGRELNEDLRRLRRRNHVGEALDQWVARRAREK